MTSTHNVRVELETRLSPEGLADALLSSFDPQWDPVVTMGRTGRSELTVTVPRPSPVEAARHAARVVNASGVATVYAIESLPTADWDRRMDEDTLLTVPEAANLLCVSPQRVRQLIDNHQMPARRIGRDWVTNLAAVNDRMDAR